MIQIDTNVLFYSLNVEKNSMIFCRFVSLNDMILSCSLNLKNLRSPKQDAFKESLSFKTFYKIIYDEYIFICF